MSELNILLGVTGSIAAYKAPEIVRRLRDRGASVQVVMTSGASRFITATSLQAVSGRPVRDNLWDDDAEAAMSHIELARWADLVLIAPATAELMSQLASGSAGDLLTTVCLATEAPVMIAPAMNRIMWAHPAVQANRETLGGRGVQILGPGSGGQACGEFGEGRMLEPEDIADAAMMAITALAIESPAPGQPGAALAGRTVMITAGPTREAIDPVRFISNHSSGKMGYAMAKAAAEAGARVILISGPVSLARPANVDVVDVESADQMFAETHNRIDGVDIFIGAAAVSDYRPANMKKQKIKKNNAELKLDLVKAPDTLASVSRLDNAPFTVGFAAETERLREYALAKLEGKKLDLIVANQVGGGRGFNCEDNAVEVYWKTGERSFPMMNKSRLAVELVGLIAERYEAGRGSGKATELPAMATMSTMATDLARQRSND
ncbi:MAG TPA: bifunctional phosphopantothenoylcysteine decarboxylase/phosphopantothenate--cysteine ligase CoaBC [Woeseiaceae bacterium]|nr:bifunctional phosphopantothenoylcysteine decarboxylase/phosphopantothenate--cysteine ligase CoaBC [Woeseiaceae bacterium]